MPSTSYHTCITAMWCWCFLPPCILLGCWSGEGIWFWRGGQPSNLPEKSIIRPMIKQSYHRPSRQHGKKLVFILWTTMKYQHQPIFQLQIPPSTPHSQTSPYFIHCLQLPPHFTLCPKPHPAQVQAPKPIRTHSMVILILLPSSHSPPMSLPELPPHQWLIQSPLLKSPCQTTHPPLLHHQRYLQGSQYPMASNWHPCCMISPPSCEPFCYSDTAIPSGNLRGAPTTHWVSWQPSEQNGMSDWSRHSNQDHISYSWAEIDGTAQLQVDTQESWHAASNISMPYDLRRWPSACWLPIPEEALQKGLATAQEDC